MSVGAPAQVFPLPEVPHWLPGPGGAAVTPEGGIFVSASSVELWKACRQKFYQAQVLGRRRRVEEEPLLLGSLYGHGVGTWIMTKDRARALGAMEREKTRRASGLALPEQIAAVEQIHQTASRYVVRYMEVYPNGLQDPYPLAMEGAFVLQLPGSPHWLVGLVDLPLDSPVGLGFMDHKTTSERDKVRYLRQYEMDGQMSAYAWALGQLSTRIGRSPGFGGAYLDVCVKPPKPRASSAPPATVIDIDDDGNPVELRTARKGRRAAASSEPDFYRQMIFPQPRHVDLWARQAAQIATEIKWFLDYFAADPDAWTRRYAECWGPYRASPCPFYNGCFREEYGDLVTTEDLALRDPGVILKRAGLPAAGTEVTYPSNVP